MTAPCLFLKLPPSRTPKISSPYLPVSSAGEESIEVTTRSVDTTVQYNLEKGFLVGQMTEKKIPRTG